MQNIFWTPLEYQERYAGEQRANEDGGLIRKNCDLGPFFCKSFAPVANNCRDGLLRCSLSVRPCLGNICLCSAKRCCGNVAQSFSHLSTWCKATVRAGVLSGESSQRETKTHASAFP